MAHKLLTSPLVIILGALVLALAAVLVGGEATPGQPWI
jgi:hypothetical protein